MFGNYGRAKGAVLFAKTIVTEIGQAVKPNSMCWGEPICALLDSFTPATGDKLMTSHRDEIHKN